VSNHFTISLNLYDYFLLKVFIPQRFGTVFLAEAICFIHYFMRKYEKYLKANYFLMDNAHQLSSFERRKLILIYIILMHLLNILEVNTEEYVKKRF
jgi:succinate dehydrogenase hydrophobic anchor subunit